MSEFAISKDGGLPHMANDLWSELLNKKINARKGNKMKEEIITTAGKSKYPTECGNITSVEINGSKLDYAFDSDVLDFTAQPSKPNKFFLKYDENRNIVFYPTPDDVYSVKISYE